MREKSGWAVRMSIVMVSVFEYFFFYIFFLCICSFLGPPTYESFAMR